MTNIKNPIWIDEALRHIGLQEFSGNSHNPQILSWWKAIKRGGIKDDETPWCAAFVGGCLEAVGIQSSRFESAKSYITWGINLRAPAYGCIAILYRDLGGHVGFVIGKDEKDRILLLGGNQSNGVNIKAFERSKIIAYRWPKGQSIFPIGMLPTVSGIDVSISES